MSRLATITATASLLSPNDIYTSHHFNSGLSIVGRDNYGVFPLRGKLLNVRDAQFKHISNNEEIQNLVKILGLKYGTEYNESNVKTLRYGHLMIMTDQDTDGSHIKGLLINFIHSK